MIRDYTDKTATAKFKYRCKGACRAMRSKTIKIAVGDTDSAQSKQKQLIEATNQFDYICNKCR